MPRGGVIVRFFCPRGRALALSLRPGNGEFAISNKFPRDFSPDFKTQHTLIGDKMKGLSEKAK